MWSGRSRRHLLKAKLIASEGDHADESELQQLPGRLDAREEVIDLLGGVSHGIARRRDIEVLTVVCVHLKIISSMILSEPTRIQNIIRGG